MRSFAPSCNEIQKTNSSSRSEQQSEKVKMTSLPSDFEPGSKQEPEKRKSL